MFICYSVFAKNYLSRSQAELSRLQTLREHLEKYPGLKPLPFTSHLDKFIKVEIVTVFSTLLGKGGVLLEADQSNVFSPGIFLTF
jgi:hypothetical protein